MKKNMLVMVMLTVGAIVGLAGVTSAQEPPAQKPAETAVSVDGTWLMSLDGPQGPMQITMVLKQEDTKVTGSLTSQMGETALEGTFEAGKLAFGIIFDAGGQMMEIYFAGDLKEDGTLAGALSGPMGDMPWVAERAK